MSAVFAASSEFKNTYGGLSDAGFVELVYQNVLHRSVDPAGGAYWLGKLQGGLGRGQLMTKFSESGEFCSTSRGTTVADDVADAMLKARFNYLARQFWALHIQRGGSSGRFALAMTTVPQYAELG